MSNAIEKSEKDWELRSAAECLIRAEKIKSDPKRYKKVVAEAAKMLKEKKKEKVDEINDLTQFVKKAKRLG